MFEITNEILVSILVFILTLFISFQILSKFFQDKKIASIVSLCLSFLAIWYIPFSNLPFLIETYSYLGIILLSLFPFLIALFFIYNSELNSFVRKFFWILYGSITFFLIRENTFSGRTVPYIFLLGIIILTTLLVIFDTWIKNKISTIQNLSKVRTPK
jgi:hypothetical protein